MDPKEPLAITGPSDDFTATIAMENTNARANAAFIVRACNAHDYLLKALQAIVAILDGRQPIDVPGAVMVAQSAISKAQGEQS
jgi:hypothetical protein